MTDTLNTLEDEASNALNALRSGVTGQLKENRKTIFWTGIAFTILGIGALVFPGVTSIAVELTVAWLLLFGGLISLYNSFSYKGAGPFFGAFLVSILYIAAGVYFIFQPTAGLVVLTLILAALFLAEGAFKMALAFEAKPLKGWGWILCSSILSIILGIVIASGITKGTVLTIGILLGINLLFSGIAFLIVANKIKKMPE